MSRYDIYMQKGQQEGHTPIGAQSPAPETKTAGSPPLTIKSGVMIGYGLMAARRAYSTAMDEIRAEGNEQLANQISNIVRGVGMAAIAIKAPITIIPMAISTANDIVTNALQTRRHNRRVEIERETMGNRINYMGGGVYG